MFKFIYKKQKKENKTVIRVFNIPVYKCVKKNNTTKKYFLGIRFYRKYQKCSEQSHSFEKELMRFDSMRILKERENIKFGDKI